MEEQSSVLALKNVGSSLDSVFHRLGDTVKDGSHYPMLAFEDWAGIELEQQQFLGQGSAGLLLYFWTRSPEWSEFHAAFRALLE